MTRPLLLLTVSLGLAACGAGSPPADAPVQGLAADQAGVGAEATTPAPADTAPRRGLFGLFGGGGDSDAGGPAVAQGTALPFGEVASVCGLSSDALGGKVAEAPKEGRARWALHDPAPASTGPRTQYLTGFDDRCARQFTGALVLFGAAGVHEANRYADTARPYSATDTAYEQLKSRICGVRPRVPCPGDRLDRLESAVVFVTVYTSFGTSGEWFELLLSDGKLIAQGLSKS